MAKTFYTLADLNTGDVLPETYLDQNNTNHASLIVPPMVRVVGTAAQSLGNGTATALTFHAAQINTDGMWTSGSVVTIQTDGVYHVTGNIRFQASATGSRVARLAVGTATPFASQAVDTSTSINHELNVSGLWPLSAGDELVLIGFQSSGGALNSLNVLQYAPMLSAAWVGRLAAP